jgi:hypothetical protein
LTPGSHRFFDFYNFEGPYFVELRLKPIEESEMDGWRSLNQFPSELLSIIVHPLDAHDIGRLYMTGNANLRHKLGLERVVTRFQLFYSVNSGDCFPSLVHAFPELHDFSISAPLSSTHITFAYRFEDFPQMLRRLTLGYPFDLPFGVWLCTLPSPPFPLLEELYMGRSDFGHRLAVAAVKLLPRGLRVLEWISLRWMGVEFLPPLLEKISCLFVGVCSLDTIVWPPNIRELDLDSENRPPFACLSSISQSLERLTLKSVDLKDAVEMLTPRIKWLSAEHKNGQIPTSVWRSLPPNLNTLILRGGKMLPLETLHLLPHTLTEVDIGKWSTWDAAKFPFIEFPPLATNLHQSTFSLPKTLEMKLPPTLTSITLGTTTLNDKIGASIPDTVLSLHCQHPLPDKFPPRLSTLLISDVENLVPTRLRAPLEPQTSIAALPSSLTLFQAPSAYFVALEQLNRLKSMVHLSLGGPKDPIPIFPLSILLRLPRYLLSLRLCVSQWYLEDSCPQSLRARLSSISDLHDLNPDQTWPLVLDTLHLRTLWIRVEREGAMMPIDIGQYLSKFLDLTNLHLYPMAPLTNQFMQSLPKNLKSLSIDGEATQLTTDCLSVWPRFLSSISLPECPNFNEIAGNDVRKFNPPPWINRSDMARMGLARAYLRPVRSDASWVDIPMISVLGRM